MQKGKAGMFKALYGKELREVRLEILLIAAITVFFTILVYLKTDGNVRGFIMVPGMMTLGLAIFIPVLTSFKLFSRDWRNNTVCLRMSLPVSGTILRGSKLLALVTQYLAGTLVVVFTVSAAVFISFPEIWQLFTREPIFVQMALLMYLAGFTKILFIFCASFMSQVSGRVFSRGSGLITFVMFIALLILLTNVMPEPNALSFTGVIDPTGTQGQVAADLSIFRQALNSAEYRQAVGYILMTSAIDLLASVLLFAGSVIIWERRVEL